MTSLPPPYKPKRYRMSIRFERGDVVDLVNALEKPDPMNRVKLLEGLRYRLITLLNSELAKRSRK